MRLIDADALSEYTGYALSASGEFAKDTNVPNTDVVPITREVNVIHGEIDVKNGTVTYHPDTSDVVEVVRCKDCIHWNSGTNDAESWEYCTLLKHYMGGDMFCSHGERKDGDRDD